jgi:hypothetical protein
MTDHQFKIADRAVRRTAASIDRADQSIQDSSLACSAVTMSNNKIIVLRPNLPLRPAQPRTKDVREWQRQIRDLSSKLRELRNARSRSAR